MRNSRLVRLAAECAALASVGACFGGGGGSGGNDNAGTTNPPAALVLEIVAGNSQTVTVGKAVAAAPSVRVKNAQGAPQSGKAVMFAVTGGGGTVTGAAQATDAGGIATLGSWTLGTTAGANVLTATVAGATGSPATFTATGTAGPAASLSKVAGDALSSAVGAAVTTKPAVKVVDQYQNAVSGSAITFAVAGGGGTASGTSQTSGADGVATVGAWTLGTVAGPNTMTATVGGSGVANSPATFTVTGVAGQIAALAKVAGDNQTAAPGATVAVAPQVRATDQYGNLLSGQAVLFAIASGGGGVSGASQTTNAGGLASVGGWTLGPAAGANSLTATAGSVTATFNATAAVPFNATQYAGTYTGTWLNTTFGSTGTGNAKVVVNAATSTVAVTVNVTGNVLGVGGVNNSLSNGSYTNSGSAFTGNVAPMGDIVASVDAGGAITASGTNVPNPSISRWDATGTITATAINLTFTVTFKSGPPATGTITMAK